jgi:hypothetical protein
VPDLIDVVIPARLLLRALDDFHAIAQAARTLPEIEQRFLERLDGMQAQSNAMLAMGDRMYEQGQAMYPIAQRLADTAGPLQGASERLGKIVDLLPDWPLG